MNKRSRHPGGSSNTMFIILQGGFKTKTQYRLGKKLYTEGNRRWLLGGFGGHRKQGGSALTGCFAVFQSSQAFYFILSSFL